MESKQLMDIIYVVALAILIIGIMTSSEHYNDQCQFPNCTASENIPQFRTLVKDFSCTKAASIKNALNNTNRFTISAILDVSGYNMAPEWQRLFSAGDNQATRRTPGVWINQGYLYAVASTSHNYNEGCFKISPPLDRDTHYHLVLVYDHNRIDVYLDGQKLSSCTTIGVIKPESDLWVGKWPNEGGGANINMTLTYLPIALDEQDVRSCWLYIKDLVKSSMKMEWLPEPVAVKPEPVKPVVAKSTLKDCTADENIPQFRTLVKNFSCTQTGLIKNALDNTNRFTVSAILDISEYNANPEWQRLFNAGNNQATLRTPGVWINQGYLYVVATTTHNYNEGCFKISPPLKRNTQCHLVLVYNPNRIDVYLDGKKLSSCTTIGVIRPERDLWMGKWPDEGAGARISMTITYLPIALDEQTVQACWRNIKDVIKSPMKIE